jgi:hypothetical protein
MRITKGKVVNRSIVVEGEPLDEGAGVTVLVSDERVITLSPAEEAILLESIAEADRDELVGAEDVLKQLP